jgi:capsular exopolysaccharide synthesis family protein
MSYIFDALQRSQAEQAKAAGGKKSIAAIELLERAEREATAQHASESLEEQTADNGVKLQSPLLNGKSYGASGTEADLLAVSDALRDEQRREIFSQFQTLDISQSEHGRLVCVGDNDSPATEAFHLLGMRLRNMRREQDFKSLLITSTVPEEGKSLVTANLACILGSGGRQRVVLLEGDVRRPSQSKVFGLDQVPGLCNYLLGKRSLPASLYHLPKAGIWILPAGHHKGDVRELLQSPKLPELMTTLGSWFDWVVIDSPPVLPLVDTSVWARLADRILIVARPGTTRKSKLQKGLEAIDPNKLIGALLNSSNSTGDGYDYYYTNATETPKDK